MKCEFDDNIFDLQSADFDALALEIFLFQYHNNPVYQQFCNTLHTKPRSIKLVQEIPFLPISLFKTQRVVAGDWQPELVFESSGTTQTVNSKHYVKNALIYKESFTRGFEQFYGSPNDYCILALLPAYLERKNSSLVLMADELIKMSKHPSSGFYLYNHEALRSVLQELEAAGQKTILIGVTFALLDFAERYPLTLKHTIIMETGGMKGRREELTREQVHEILTNAFSAPSIHSEYGMTELLSQAYSAGKGLFSCPPWMKILLREEDDPRSMIVGQGRGVINIIDLANIYSCSFIASDDVGRLYPNGNFEVLGRVDNSDLRGCSLMVL
jgi:phenylacetate-coenzyme A ligase PaaK-like adenylate-forming protein